MGIQYISKRLLTSLLVVSMLSSGAFAKAGSSVSRSSVSKSSSSKSSPSSSKSYSSSSSSVGTKANNSTPTTQYSSSTTASKPSTSGTSTSSSTSSGSSAGSVAGATSTPSAGSTSQNFGSTNFQQNSIPNYSNSGGGFWSGVAGGVTGFAVADMIFGNRHAAPVYTNSQGGYVNSGGSGGSSGTGSVSAGSGGQMVYTQETTFWSILGAFIGTIIKLAIIASLIYIGYRIYKYFRNRKVMNDPSLRDENLPRFKNMFVDIQNYTAAGNMVQLAPYCTTEMYDHFMVTRSENMDNGVTNMVEDIEVKDIVTKNYEVDTETGDVYHTVKIRYSMVDYFVDSNGEVVVGDKEKATEDIEVWTFVSKNSGKNWKLSAIEQYVR